MKPQILEYKIVYDGWAKYLLANVRLEDGHTAEREIVKREACVAVLPYDPERKVAMLVSQFRAPVLMEAGEKELLEAIAGMCDGGAADEAARREADEETGLKLHAMDRLGAMWTSPGGSTERMTLYLAPYHAADREGEGGGASDEHENITAMELPLAELARMADAAQIADMKTFALVQTLRVREPDLFR
jgi:nudix-type nucleoside diphosphatase (YffH/AdpP family)